MWKVKMGLIFQYYGLMVYRIEWKIRVKQFEL